MAKNQTMPSNTLRLNFCYLEIVYIHHPRYHLKIVEHILKNKQKNSRDCMINHNENKDENKKLDHKDTR